ncbi:Uncharacterized protein GBIM_10903, partial [Gryllus bimaculatus]
TAAPRGGASCGHVRPSRRRFATFRPRLRLSLRSREAGPRPPAALCAATQLSLSLERPVVAPATPVVARRRRRRCICRSRSTAMQALSLLMLVAAAAGAASAVAVLPSHAEEEPTTAGPPQPYSFAYAAGRFPNHVRRVEYVADAHGFHPVLSSPVADTPAVAAAKQRHAALLLFGKE